MYLANRNNVSLRQVSLSVTGTNWTTTRAVGIPYRTINGDFRLRINITGSFSSGTTTALNPLTLIGVVFKSGVVQGLTVADGVGSTRAAGEFVTGARVTGGGSSFDVLLGANMSIANEWRFSGDVELESEPLI